jgi:diguanylate cyclase (GGDEF)-like protein
MPASRILWLGTRRPAIDGSRFLAAAGFRIETYPALAAALAEMTGMPEVVVVAHEGSDTPGNSLPPILAALPEGTKVVALVPHPADVVAALVAGAHDAVLGAPLPGAGDELYFRVLAWARAARSERQQRAALTAMIDRSRQLEDRLSSRERKIAELHGQAHSDELTGLGNRRSFGTNLDFVLDYGARYGGTVAVIVCDLDGMKRINDCCGHAGGDAALRTVAEIFRASLRSVDHAARLGGDEFGVVMPETDLEDAARVAERIRDRIEGLILPMGMRLSASFGVAALLTPMRGVGFAGEEVLARADAAMYVAKRRGKNRVAVDGIRGPTAQVA